jgi:hypothetical protein
LGRKIGKHRREDVRVHRSGGVKIKVRAVHRVYLGNAPASI